MDEARHPQHARAIAWLLLATVFWGLSFPLIKAITLVHARLAPDAGTWFSATYTVAPRFALAALALLAWRPRSVWRMTGAEARQGVVMGMFAAAGMLLQNDALQFTAASTSAFLTQCSAILIPAAVAGRDRRWPGARVGVACALVLAGVAVLGKFDWRELRFGRGEAETLLSSVFFTGQILWLGKKEFAANRAGPLTLAMFATEAAVFAALAVAAAPDARTLLAPWGDGAWLGLTAAITVFCTLGSFGLMNAWQPKITATEAGLIYCAEPIFGTLLALCLPAVFSAWAAVDYANEVATAGLLVGGGLITVANVLIQVRPAGAGARE